MKYIVSDDRAFIYFVVQKVACTSIKNALLPLFDVDGDAGIHRRFTRSGYQINQEQFLRRLEDEYRGYFKFAFVRNPWDRLVSCYLQKLTGQGKGLKQADYEGFKIYVGMSFAKFVEAVHAIPDAEANIHFKSQHAVICSPGEDRSILADFVGRFENLEADFRLVAEKIGAPELRLPHMLPSRNRHSRPYTEFYDDRLRDLVGERYREDIEVFGYSF